MYIHSLIQSTENQSQRVTFFHLKTGDAVEWGETRPAIKFFQS